MDAAKFARHGSNSSASAKENKAAPAYTLKTEPMVNSRAGRNALIPGEIANFLGEFFDLFCLRNQGHGKFLRRITFLRKVF
jgi:hypothetical protein